LLAFIHIAKTAGSTIGGILRRNFSTRHFDARIVQQNPAMTASQLKRVMLLYPRLASISGHAVRPDSDLKSAFPQIRYYTFLRDPRSRLVSLFYFMRGMDVRDGRWRPDSNDEIESAFLDFVSQPRRSYCDILAPNGGGAPAAIEVIETQVEFVGLVEHFDESLALLKNWIGDPKFDPSYRRLNDSERRGVSDELKYRSVQQAVDRLVKATKAFAARPDVADRLAVILRDDVALYGHVRDKTFERMRRQYSAGPGPFALESKEMAVDTVPARLYRNLVAKPLLPLIAR